MLFHVYQAKLKQSILLNKQNRVSFHLNHTSKKEPPNSTYFTNKIRKSWEGGLNAN